MSILINKKKTDPAESLFMRIVKDTHVNNYDYDGNSMTRHLAFGKCTNLGRKQLLEKFVLGSPPLSLEKVKLNRKKNIFIFWLTLWIWGC